MEPPSTSHEQRPLRRAFFRIVAYLILLHAFLLGLLTWMRELKLDAVRGESGAIEVAQLITLLSGIALLFHAPKSHPARVLLRLVSILAMVAFVRELDAAFDMLAHGAWKVPALALLLIAASYGRTHSRRIPRELESLRHTSAMGLMVAAFLLLGVVSRLFGMQVVWEDVFAEQYQRAFPRLIEELFELAGYTLFVIGSIEARVLPVSGDQENRIPRLAQKRGPRLLTDFGEAS